MFDAGFHLFYAPNDDLGLVEAREYVKQMGYTPDEVRITRNETRVLVITKTCFLTLGRG